MDAIPDTGCGPGSDGSQPRVMPYTRRWTDDRDEAERIVNHVYLPHRLDLSEGSAALGMEIAGLRLGALTVGRLTYGRRVRVRTAEAENFHVNIALRGRRSPAATCHGPWTLVEADRVRGRRLTSWPSLRTDLPSAGAEVVDEEVVTDGSITTSRSPDDLPAFCERILQEFARGPQSV